MTPGGKAAQAGVGVGDWVVSISEANAEEMTHVEAQNKIRAATDSLTLTLSRYTHAHLLSVLHQCFLVSVAHKGREDDLTGN